MRRIAVSYAERRVIINATVTEYRYIDRNTKDIVLPGPPEVRFFVPISSAAEEDGIHTCKICGPECTC